MNKLIIYKNNRVIVLMSFQEDNLLDLKFLKTSCHHLTCIISSQGRNQKNYMPQKFYLHPLVDIEAIYHYENISQ